MPLHSLMFGWEYPPAHCGGLGVACQGIVRGLLHHGAHVTLVLPHDQSNEEGASIITPTTEQWQTSLLSIPSALHPYDSVSTYQDRLTTMQTSTHAGSGISHLYGQDLGEEVERFTAIAVDMTKNIVPDVVHSHDWMTMEAGVRAARHHDKPLIAHVHATELDRTEFHPNEWIYGKEQWGLSQAQHVIAVSQYTKNLLVREYGIREENISVLHNGSSDTPVTIHRRDRNTRHPLILFLGRLTVQKGALHFLRAAKEVARLNPDARFVVAGEGYLLPELIEQACTLGLQEKIIFAGKVQSDEAAILYAKADCFVMPSVSEPFGLVALEAISHGAPVILSRQSGAAEVVHNSFVVDFWDTDKMADCILTVLREKAIGHQMRSQTPRILRNLSWNTQAAKIIAIYDKLRHAQ